MGWTFSRAYCGALRWAVVSVTYFDHFDNSFVHFFTLMKRYGMQQPRMMYVSIGLALMWIVNLSAQIGGVTSGGNTSMEDMMRLMQLSSSNSSGVVASSEPIDDIINPAEYRVGPGDVLVYVSPDMREQTITITPENTLILPRFGDINVQGKTLQQVKADVQRLVSERISGAKAYIILQKPRIVYVTVRGNVARQGSYTAPASMRASTFVELVKNGTLNIQTNNQQARTPSQQAKQNEQQLITLSTGYYICPHSVRSMSLFRRDGTAETIDAIASSLGIKGSDVLLREGDEIYIPYEPENYPQISSGGKVRRPTILPYRKGDKLSFLWKAGYGFAEDADTTQVSVYYPNEQQPQKVSITTLRSGILDREIPAGTKIVAERRISAGEDMVIFSVTGQVQSPGTVSLPKSRARLKTALESAGGMLNDAYPPLAYIVRKDMLSKNTGAEYELAQSMLSSDLTAFDTARYKMDILLRRPMVSCNIEAALRDSLGKDNIEIQQGDMIVIPTNPNNVYVFGGVNKPGFVTYEKGKDMAWYIAQAGGYSGFSERERTRIIKGTLRNWVDPKENSLIESGDQIFVPRQPDYPPTLALQKRSTDIQETLAKIQEMGVKVQEEGVRVQRENLLKTIELQEGALSLQKWGLIIGLISTIISGIVLYTTINKQP